MAGSEARETVTIGVATPARMTVHYAYLTPATALGYDWDEGLDLRIFQLQQIGASDGGKLGGERDVAVANLEEPLPDVCWGPN